jgi:hypothetical protein
MWQDIGFAPPAHEFRTDKDGRVQITGVIGDLDYSLGCQGLVESNNDERRHPFRAAPGQTKDLGTISPKAMPK